MRVRWGIFQKCWVCSETLSQSDKTGTGLSPSESGWTGQIRTFVVFYRPEGGELAKKSASSSKSEVNSELAKKSASYTFPTQRTMNSPKNHPIKYLDMSEEFSIKWKFVSTSSRGLFKNFCAKFILARTTRGLSAEIVINSFKAWIFSSWLQFNIEIIEYTTVLRTYKEHLFASKSTNCSLLVPTQIFLLLVPSLEKVGSRLRSVPQKHNQGHFQVTAWKKAVKIIKFVSVTVGSRNF